MQIVYYKLRALYALINFLITVTVTIVLMYLFRPYNRAIRRAWGRMQFFLLGIKTKVKGELDISANLIIINHQSLVDIMVFENIHPRDIAWVAKKEIADMWIFGHILKAPRMIIVDRENKQGLVKLLKDAKDRLDNGRPIAIFPEGTRSSGKELLKFKIGAKLLAEKYNLKIQPIVLTGTRDVLDSIKFESKRAKIGINYLPSFFPSDKGKDWYDELYNDMNKVLLDELSNNTSSR